ncbi:MAG: hypothetical protein ABJO29_04270 [Yoonia sp.]|uniref:hypothetical protein n=1 Tax=Rhodobacterales TaxID=204455 RepID=UPI001FF1DCE4|nr:hypothetical protein [Loktanella sp. F6476L]MCK0120040.1 hypothetical protein [Loktanella sp. F6476L]UWQ98844.1 hypothetical protein K3729_15715 [Rhodobacteraceae bacterium S2214]
MIKLLLLFLLLLPAIMGGLVIWALLRWFNGAPPQKSIGETLPETIRTIAFIVLVILLFGVTSGFLGAA